LIPENINIPIMEGIGNFRGVGVGVKGPEKSRERRGRGRGGVRMQYHPIPTRHQHSTKTLAK